MASGGSDKSVRIWNYERLTCEITFFGHLDMIKSLKSIDHLELIASGSADYKIKIWSLKTKKIVI
jgi:F-box/WD-40 domain protein 7